MHKKTRVRPKVAIPKTQLRPVSLSPTARSKKKRAKKRFLLNLPKRGFYSKRRPGFDAFEVKQHISDEKGKVVQKVEVISPEHGIHSQAWALSIEPQDSPFLKLPLEIRSRIYNVAIASHNLTLSPQKQGKKFINAVAFLYAVVAPDSPTSTYSSMSLICRQSYMEVVGGALLHKIGAFTFNSPMLMENYLTKINPFHAASISAIHLRLRLTKNAPSIPKKVFANLSNISGLQDLSLEVVLDHKICYKLVKPTTSRFANLLLNEDICVKLETLKHWQLLKGLRTFDMAFKGYDLLVSFGDKVDTGSARFVAIREEIKKVVMRLEK